MKKLSFLFLIPLIVMSCVRVETTDDNVDFKTPEKDGILIHVTAGYDNAHRVLMPFKMATLMAESKDVILYLDIHAGELVVKDAEDVVMEGFDPLSTYIETLLDKGVKIYACPTCLNVMGYTPDDLMEGIKTAEKEAFFDFTKGRIITMDY
jgi:predicted peroxiredoxin